MKTTNPEPTNTNTLPMVARYATTPKRGTPARPRREPLTLYAYAVEHGGRVDLTDATKQELLARGLRPDRISVAVYDLRAKFGKTITTERQGRAASAYIVSL